MSDRGGTERNPSPVTPGASGYSKDHWDLFFAQLAKRRLVKLAAAVLVLLYATAIYAPLVANDRPYVLAAADYRAYGQAHKTLYPVTLSLRRLLRQAPEEYLARRVAGSTQTHGEAVEAEVGAALERVSTLWDSLPEDRRAPLERYRGLLARARPGARGQDAESVAALTDSLKSVAREIRSDLRPIDLGEPGAEGVVLRSRLSFPLFASLGAFEVLAMVIWAALLTWPLWNRWVNLRWLGGDPWRIRRARGRKLAGVLALASAIAMVWGAVNDEASPFNLAGYKTGLTSGEIVAQVALFPPVALGFSETHLAENFRPPTWTRGADLDERGYYQHGYRVPKADPLTGYLPPESPVEIRHGEPALNSALRHPLGTDGSGRDLLVRLLWGGRISLSVGIVSALLLTLLGTLFGAVAGFFGRATDMVISRVIEIMISIPAFYLILMAAAFVDPDVLSPIFAIVLIIAVVGWTGVARLTRAEFLRLREQEFVQAAEALGYSSSRIMFRHLLPNAMGPILVAAAFAVAAGILTESAVSFLGFGIQHPLPSWGAVVNESRSENHWWIQLFPGLLIFITVTCYNLVGEGVRDALDPKMKVD